MKTFRSDLLAVDIGNTKIGATLIQGGTVRARWRLDVPVVAAATWSTAWSAVAAGARELGATRLPVVVASVVPERTVAVVHGLRRHGMRRVHLARWSDAWPFELARREPHTVGVDRLAHVAGLVSHGLRHGVALGIGTAVIVDVLQAGRFAGGCIFPGMDLAAGALRAGTAQLPRVRAPERAPLWGPDTRTALESGVLHGTVHAAAGMAQDIARRLGTRTPIVLTGGLADAVAAHLRGPILVDQDLLIRGLSALQGRLRGPAGSAKSFQNRPLTSER